MAASLYFLSLCLSLSLSLTVCVSFCLSISLPLSSQSTQLTGGIHMLTRHKSSGRPNDKQLPSLDATRHNNRPRVRDKHRAVHNSHVSIKLNLSATITHSENLSEEEKCESVYYCCHPIEAPERALREAVQRQRTSSCYCTPCCARGWEWRVHCLWSVYVPSQPPHSARSYSNGLLCQFQFAEPLINLLFFMSRSCHGRCRSLMKKQPFP